MPDPTPTPTPEPDPADTAPPTVVVAPGRPPLTRGPDRLVAGVCAGVGRHLGVDANVVRLALVVLVAFGGAGLLAYAAGWLLIPADGRPADRRAVLRRAGAVVGLLLLAGALALASVAAAAFGGTATVAGLAIGAGVLLAVLAFRAPRHRRWLVVPALAVVLPGAAVAAVGVDLRGGVGERSVRPSALAELRPAYRLGAGSLVIDLRDVDFDGGTHRLAVDLGVGEVQVLVPEGTCVGGRVRLGAGAAQLLDLEHDGVDVDVEEAPADRRGRTGTLVLDAEVGVGALMVDTRPVLHGRDDDRYEARFGEDREERFTGGCAL